MKKTIIITGIVVVLTSIALILFVRFSSVKRGQVNNLAEVKRGRFEIVVANTGELIAEKSQDIRGPDVVNNMNFRAGIIRILDIVPEGTIVKKGEYIASLDKTNFENTMKDEVTKLDKMEADYKMKILDTSVVLSTLRDDIKDQTFTVEEAQILVEQSKYDPPATQRQAEIELDKSRRFLEWKQRLYFLRYAQASMETRNLKKSFEIQRKKVNDLQAILAEFTVKAPSDGMVIYKKDRLGVRRVAGSFINPWDPVVATLPDLSSMISKTYVNEIDVNKVQTGQAVQVTIDAFPKKSYTGQVMSIANIGEQIPNSDSKVFEVLVKINESDPLLRPSMTTGNKVITKSFDNVVYVPIESVRAGEDNITYVYTKEGFRQVVIPGESNDKHLIIEKGLAEGTSVFLTPPENFRKFKLAGNELIPSIRERKIANDQGYERTGKDVELPGMKLSDLKILQTDIVKAGYSGQRDEL